MKETIKNLLVEVARLTERVKELEAIIEKSKRLHAPPYSRPKADDVDQIVASANC